MDNSIDLIQEAGLKINGQEPLVQEKPEATQSQEQTNTDNIPADKAAIAEPAKATEQAQPQFNFDDELVKITDGKIKSQTDLAGMLEKYGQLNDFESRLQQLDSENTELKAKVATDPFANDLSKKFNDLLKGGAKPEQVDAFLKLNKHDNFESMSAYDAKLLALQVKEGLTEKEAKVYLESSYKLNPEEHDEDTIAREQIRLKVDARGDREFLTAHKAQVSQAPASEYEQQQQVLQEKQTAHLDKLAPIAKNALQSISFANQNINGKADDKAIMADFTPSEESVKSLPDKVAQFIKNEWNNIPANEDGAKRISDFAKSILILENHETWRQHAVNVAEKKIREEYHNPSAIQRGKDNTENAGKSDKDARSKFVEEYFKL
jgi:hypothetical protein